MSLGFVAIDPDQRRVEQCKEAGYPVIYGEANHPLVLESAGLAQARLLLITTPPLVVTQMIADHARRLRPDLHADYRTLEQLRATQRGLTLSWFTLDDGSPLVDHTLQALAIRTRTGASVVAVLRDGKPYMNPAPDFGFKAGDRIAVLADREQLAAFVDLGRSMADA